ncbi:MAG TPA: type II secretion system F family protein [Nocardioidaceae bacterium]|nr:type II secretion system F family protein [Nocardioidaceae bacterium]
MSQPGRAVRRALGRLVVSCAAAMFAVLPSASGAWAESAGSIDHVETKAGELRLLYSLPGLAGGAGPDPASLDVTINDQPVKATAALAEDTASAETVRRTTILAVDVSNSMRGERFTEAKQAALVFLEGAPDDVLVGIVTFARDVTTVQEPTLDREQVAGVIDDLTLSPQTRLYDGVIEAIGALGEEGSRSLVVLSDGKDTSQTVVDEVTQTIRTAEVKVDVVALEQSADAREPLEQIATAGGGALLTAGDPAALVELFSDEAATLANQLLVSVRIPENLSGTEGTVAISLEAAGEQFTDTAFVTLTKQSTEPAVAANVPSAVPSPGFEVSSNLMRVGLGATGGGVLLVLALALGVFNSRKKATLEDRVAAYSRTGDPRAASVSGQRGKPVAQKSVTESAVGVAQKALAGNKGLESALAAKLDAAGISLKPAEWLLLHAGIAVGAAVVGFLFTSGGVLPTLILLVAGVVVPWVYLGFKKSRRLKAFNAHLGETLQLISGGLSAGLSLAQSVDTVVREGTEPIAGEFRRALVETRLGVQVEDALDAVGERMESEDFGWVVMAIRIQRDVGGNLAELLLSVAATMREREYLRRQVKSLSAEGKLSGIILGALPPGVLLFVSVTNRNYLDPMLSSMIGWALIAAMVVLMTVGCFWMSRIVKVEV